jgi:hypothetical protein
MSADEWRVEVELDDEPEGMPLGERIRSIPLDDEARERLGDRVIVSRDGPHLFLYAATEDAAREAERVLRDLLDAHELTARVAVTRWHPDEEEWEDASIPLPQTDAERDAERGRREAAEEREAEIEGSYDWRVKAELPHRHDAVEIARSIAAAGHDVHRRWRYLTIGVPTEERGEELAEEIRATAPEGTEVWVEVNPDDLPHTPFDFIPPLG